MSSADNSDGQVRAAIAICGDELSAIAEVVRTIPPDLGISVVVSCAQPDLAGALSAVSRMPVVDVHDETRFERDRLYALPADREVTFEEDSLIVAPMNGRGRVDRLLRSLADARGRDTVAVILARHDSDGALGVRRIKEAGGISIFQRLEHDSVDGMPHTAIAGGLADLVLPIEEIGPRLVALIGDRTREHPLEMVDAESREPIADTLRDVLALIRIRTGHDFNWYKHATLYRRISRRMQVCQTSSLSEYQRFLRDHPTELASLLGDLLISVTNFFRDPASLDALSEEIMPRFFKDRAPNDQIRIWVAGCATGEEAYSLGILFSEHAARIPDPPPIQIFATDIDEQALAVARAGVYPEGIEADVSRARLEKFFVREADQYRVGKELRDMVLFSSHNVLRDPPFSRLDLVSCRNLLIYLNRDAQDRVLGTFHFALKPEGVLLLGSSESAEATQQFVSLDPKHRIFERRNTPSRLSVDALVGTARWTPTRALTPPPLGERQLASFGELHHRIVEQYAPPSVLVNEDLDVVHVSEHAGKYLEVQGGEPTRQVLRLVKPALRFELRGAIYAARQSERKHDSRIVRFEEDGKPRVVDLRVHSVDGSNLGRGTLLVLFEELDGAAAVVPVINDPNLEPVMREMEDELHRTRDQLRTTVEQYETSLEELKASNEELQAINEELRSATEELETSKEELQAVNEELTTVNLELKSKIDELSRANSDLQNLITSTDLGVLFLDRNLMIKMFTPRMQDLFNIIPSDIGRPFAHVTHRLTVNDLVETAREVLGHLRSIERELTTADQRVYLLRILPYRSIEDRIEGVVLVFIDVTDLRSAEAANVRSAAALVAIEARLAMSLRSAPVTVISLDTNLQPTWVFSHGRELPLQDLSTLDVFVPGNGERFLAASRGVVARGISERVEIDLAIEGAVRTYDFRIEPRNDTRGIVGVDAVGFDITPSKLAELSLLDADRRKDEFLATLSHELRNPLTPLRIAFDVARMPNAGPAEIATAMSIMDHQIQVMVRLVDDLLDLARITQGKIQLDLATLDPVSVLAGAIDAARPMIEEAGHELRIVLPKTQATIIGDAVRLTQVVVNLLTNAARYTPGHGHITLESDVQDGHLMIRVSDDGVGISEVMLPRIFEIFVQSRDERGRSRNGLGIGLNLVRRLVELHHGTVTAESAGPGHGSVFTVRLPIAAKEG